MCTWNVWHIQIASGLTQAALRKWCCLASFTPNTRLQESGVSTWFPCLSLTISEEFFDSELCWDERTGEAQKPSYKSYYTQFSKLEKPCINFQLFIKEFVGKNTKNKKTPPWSCPYLASLPRFHRILCCALSSFETSLMESLSFGEASAQRILSLSICSCSKCSLKEHICFIEILQQILFCYCEGQGWDFRELLFSKASSAKLPSTCSFLELFPSTMLPATSPVSLCLAPSLSLGPSLLLSYTAGPGWAILTESATFRIHHWLVASYAQLLPVSHYLLPLWIFLDRTDICVNLQKHTHLHAISLQRDGTCSCSVGFMNMF